VTQIDVIYGYVYISSRMIL